MRKFSKGLIVVAGITGAGLLVLPCSGHAAPPPFQAIVNAVNAAAASITSAINASTAAIVAAIKAGNSSSGSSSWPPSPANMISISNDNLYWGTSGTSPAIYVVPSGQSLVVTDVNFLDDEGFTNCSLVQESGATTSTKLILSITDHNEVYGGTSGYRFHSSLGIAFASGSSLNFLCKGNSSSEVGYQIEGYLTPSS